MLDSVGDAAQSKRLMFFNSSSNASATSSTTSSSSTQLCPLAALLTKAACSSAASSSSSSAAAASACSSSSSYLSDSSSEQNNRITLRNTIFTLLASAFDCSAASSSSSSSISTPLLCASSSSSSSSASCASASCVVSHSSSCYPFVTIPSLPHPTKTLLFFDEAEHVCPLSCRLCFPLFIVSFSFVLSFRSFGNNNNTGVPSGCRLCSYGEGSDEDGACPHHPVFQRSVSLSLSSSPSISHSRSLSIFLVHCRSFDIAHIQSRQRSTRQPTCMSSTALLLTPCCLCCISPSSSLCSAYAFVSVVFDCCSSHDGNAMCLPASDCRECLCIRGHCCHSCPLSMATSELRCCVCSFIPFLLLHPPPPAWKSARE